MAEPSSSTENASARPRILITGGAGFVGSALADRFLAGGYGVVIVDDLSTGNLRNLRHLDDHPDVSFVQADVSASIPVDGPLHGILHFASPASPKDYLRLPFATLKVGSLGTFNVLDLAVERGARVLLASTSEVYGDPLVHPQREDYWGNVNPNGPRSVYDEAKRFAEATVMAYHRERGVDTRLVRIFNTYGPRMAPDDGRVVPAFVCQALRGEPLTIFGDGAQTRSFCYVGDLVEGIFRVYEGGDEQPYNIGNPTEHTIREFAETIQRQLGATEITLRPLPQDDPKRRQPDIGRIHKELGWQPQVGLHDGLERTIAYFRDDLGIGG